MNGVLILDSEFQNKLKSVLSDPEALSKITAIASSLGLNGQSSEPEPKNEALSEPTSDNIAESLPALSSLMPQQSDPRLALLTSLKPLLREDKRDRIDALTRALTVASMMKTFRK